MSNTFEKFILQRAIYDGDLSQAIFDKDEKEMYNIIKEFYIYEAYCFVIKESSHHIEEILSNPDRLLAKHINDIENIFKEQTAKYVVKQ